MTKVVHCKRELYDVYIGRPTIYGNPFSHQAGSAASVRVRNRKEAIQKHMVWIRGEIVLKGVTPPTMEQILMLSGKTLGCWCRPRSCHGDNYAYICDIGAQ